MAFPSHVVWRNTYSTSAMAKATAKATSRGTLTRTGPTAKVAVEYHVVTERRFADQKNNARFCMTSDTPSVAEHLHDVRRTERRHR